MPSMSARVDVGPYAPLAIDLALIDIGFLHRGAFGHVVLAVVFPGLLVGVEEVLAHQLVKGGPVGQLAFAVLLEIGFHIVRIHGNGLRLSVDDGRQAVGLALVLFAFLWAEGEHTGFLYCGSLGNLVLAVINVPASLLGGFLATLLRIGLLHCNCLFLCHNW